MDFEDYVVREWPSDVPTDCTALDSKERDCIDQGLPEGDYCQSCKTYALLWQKFENK